MKTNYESLPVAARLDGIDIRRCPMGDDMILTLEESHKPTDYGEMLKNCKDGMCQVRHWIYVIRGKICVDYTDGSSETLHQGDIGYLPPGHHPRYLKPGLAAVFSPASELLVEREKFTFLEH